jgi:ATP-binding cassette subfamily G (WHITE) protein 2 (SNQ2)
MSNIAAGGSIPVLGAPIGAGGNPIVPGNHGDDHVTHANAEAATGKTASTSSSSPDKRTLNNNDGDVYGEGNDKALPLPKHMGQHDSARSSQDHVAELGEGRVSVHKGKAEFAALERRFSNMSQHSQELQRSNTRQSRRSMSGFTRPEKTATRQSQQIVDSEKGGKTEDDEFNLADVLRSGRDKSDQSGIKRKKVGVVWEDLEVVGGGGLKINIRNFVSAIIEQFLMPVLMILGWFGYKPFATKPKTILHSSSGVMKPGEMCLVIGRPGSGCSTFLKSITNQREGYLSVNGDVSYAGVGWKEMHKLYAGYVISSTVRVQH